MRNSFPFFIMGQFQLSVGCWDETRSIFGSDKIWRCAGSKRARRPSRVDQGTLEQGSGTLNAQTEPHNKLSLSLNAAGIAAQRTPTAVANIYD